MKSIQKYGNEVFSSIDIICNWSNQDFHAGYSKLIPDSFDINPRFFHQQTKEEFGKMTMNSIDEAKSDYICFSTDDEVIFQMINREKLFDNLPKFDNHIFSLRLGHNTLVQDCHKENNFQPPLNIYLEKDGVLTWPITHYHPHHNYGYFGSLDMNVYRRSLLQKLLPRINFNNTNELEGGLTQFRNSCDYISSFTHSVAVNLPVNNLSGFTTVNDKYAYSNEELNEKFLDGYEIDLESINKTLVVGAHQQIEYIFNKIQ